MNEELRTRIAAYVKALDDSARLHFELSGYKAQPPTHRAEYTSAKWCKIVRRDAGHEHGSVSAFVCLQDGDTKTLGRLRAGDIHKPASWSTPARHARGSVFAAALGRIRTPHKTETSRRNIAKATADRIAAAPPLKPCTCGRDPHKYDCPVRHRERMAARRA